MGPVRREHTCGGIRTPAAITRRGRVRPRQVRRSRLAGRPGLGPRGCGAAGPAGRHAGPARAARRWKAEIAAAGDARSGRARAEQAESQLQRARADHDQATGQAAPAAGPGPARHRQHSPGNLPTSNHSCRTSRSARVPGRAQLAPNSSISAALCAPCFGLSATVRDGSRSAATTRRSRRGEHPGARVRMAETLICGACQQHVLRRDVQHSRRRTCNTPSAAPPAAGHAAAPIPCLLSEPEHQVTVCPTLRILHQSSSQAD